MWLGCWQVGACPASKLAASIVAGLEPPQESCRRGNDASEACTRRTHRASPGRSGGAGREKRQSTAGGRATGKFCAGRLDAAAASALRALPAASRRPLPPPLRARSRAVGLAAAFPATFRLAASAHARMARAAVRLVAGPGRRDAKRLRGSAAGAVAPRAQRSPRQALCACCQHIAGARRWAWAHNQFSRRRKPGLVRRTTRNFNGATAAPAWRRALEGFSRARSSCAVALARATVSQHALAPALMAVLCEALLHDSHHKWHSLRLFAFVGLPLRGCERRLRACHPSTDTSCGRGRVEKAQGPNSPEHNVRETGNAPCVTVLHPVAVSGLSLVPPVQRS